MKPFNAIIRPFSLMIEMIPIFWGNSINILLLQIAVVDCCCRLLSINLIILVFCPKAGSLSLVYSRRESYLLKTNKARAHLYGGAPDSFQTENSYIVGIEPGISRIEVRVLTTELRQLNQSIAQQSNYKVDYKLITLLWVNFEFLMTEKGKLYNSISFTPLLNHKSLL